MSFHGYINMLPFQISSCNPQDFGNTKKDKNLIYSIVIRWLLAYIFSYFERSKNMPVSVSLQTILQSAKYSRRSGRSGRTGVIFPVRIIKATLYVTHN